MATPSALLERIERDEIKTLDLRFTDLAGQWRRVGYPARSIELAMLEHGVLFDGSAIPGWRDVAHSDMLLKPDLETAVADPFTAQPSLIVVADVAEPATGLGYERCPRSIARRAEEHLGRSQADVGATIAHQAEFFVFDDVRFEASTTQAFVRLDGEESPANGATHYESGNRGHRPGPAGAALAAPPLDQGGDLRAEMAAMLEEMAIEGAHHHHDSAWGQHQLSTGPAPLTRSADRLQIYKHVVHSVAAAYGKTATFMPKPLAGHPGSGMQVQLSLWRAGQALFAGNGYADLSETCLHFIGGILAHARSLNAILNPTTNSYRRLAAGGNAPRHLAFAALNRSAAIRVPFASSPGDKRIEVRFADPSANPYLGFAALLMAGLDGMQRQTDPGEPIDRNLYDLPPEEVDELPTLCRNLETALDELDRDRGFLVDGDVFSDELIDALILQRRGEIEALERFPHPLEYRFYFSA
ncbi:MAG: type I glutamate--ammonia ligase [Geminicoccaceae bacterium]|nr:type I glutamate--ammonia ligase [Geminicoccaceae bacterium]